MAHNEQCRQVLHFIYLFLTHCPIYINGHSQFQRWNGPNQKLRDERVKFCGIYNSKSHLHAYLWDSLVMPIIDFNTSFKDFNLKQAAGNISLSVYFITAHSTQLQFSSKKIFNGLNFVSFIHNLVTPINNLSMLFKDLTLSMLQATSVLVCTLSQPTLRNFSSQAKTSSMG